MYGVGERLCSCDKTSFSSPSTIPVAVAFNANGVMLDVHLDYLGIEVNLLKKIYWDF